MCDFNLIKNQSGDLKPSPELPNDPVAINLAKTDEGRELIQWGINKMSQISFQWFVMSPGTPKEQEQILRKVFQEIMKDKEFHAEAEKTKIEINTVTSEEIEKTIAEILTLILAC